MGSTRVLPDGYTAILEINPSKNKKTHRHINATFFLIALLMLVAGLYLAPMGELFRPAETIGFYVLRTVVLLVGTIAYMLLHEMLHGLFMHLYHGAPVQYGFYGIYAYAGSAAYFQKKSYLVITFAPIVLLGALIAVVCCLVPPAWFWVVYLIQLLNITGATGDFYMCYRLYKLPADIMVHDSGIIKTVYEKK